MTEVVDNIATVSLSLLALFLVGLGSLRTSLATTFENFLDYNYRLRFSLYKKEVEVFITIRFD